MTWRHSDPNMVQSFQDGLAALQSGTWPSPRTRAVRDLQALQAMRLAIIGGLVGRVTYTTDPDGNTVVSVNSDVETTQGERADAARSLVGAARAFWRNSGLPNPTEQDFSTVAPGDTGVVPFITITAIVVGGAVVSFIGAKAFDYFDKCADRDAKAAALKAADAASLKVLSDHLDAEKQAGHAQPLTEAEKQVLARLDSEAQQLTAAVAKPVGEWYSTIPWYGWAIAVAGIALFAVPQFAKSGVTIVQPASRAA